MMEFSLIHEEEQDAKDPSVNESTVFAKGNSFQGVDAKLLEHRTELRRRAFTGGKLEEVRRYESAFKAATIEGPGFYTMGIIDILQNWDLDKKSEKFFKVNCMCQDRFGVSCIEPYKYRKRFLNKMHQIGIGRKIGFV